MPFDLRTADLNRLNSLTKYPSIPTYHALDPSNGRLQEEHLPFSGEAILTEKIDGTNARLIFFPDGSYLIGSRGEFLLARGDLIGNPSLGIVDALRPVADRIEVDLQPDALCVLFGEFFGGKVTQASKQYTGRQQVGFRLFDVAVIPDLPQRLGEPAEKLSDWREAGGQAFLDEDALRAEADRLALPLVPRLAVVDALPDTREDMLAYLSKTLPKTLASLDANAGQQPEGLVARSEDRTFIAKMRFQDYRRSVGK